MRIVVVIFGIVLIVLVAQDGFESVILPRQVSRRIRLARLFISANRFGWNASGNHIHSSSSRESFRASVGPLSLLALVVCWAVLFVLGFGLLMWGLVLPLNVSDTGSSFLTYLYLSDTRYFTLGLGDVIPVSWVGRLLLVSEAALGFIFLALKMSYVPVFYQAFSRREIRVALLDAWAGSPPTAAELIRRLGAYDHRDAFDRFLGEWETWAAETLESHISFPSLCFYRSQHDNQSWLAALVAVLDACALTMVGLEGLPARSAALTFAMVRHVVVDLCQILNRAPQPPPRDRLPPDDLARLREILAGAGVGLREGREADERLAELRRMYEPYVSALSDYLLMPLPAWIPLPNLRDNWQKSRWK